MTENHKILIQKLDVTIVINDSRDAMDETKMRNFIDQLIVTLDMTVLVPMLVVRVPIVGNYKDVRGRIVRADDQGITGVTCIAESHIAFHTWPKENIILVQISSCREFSENDVAKLAKDHFNCSDIKLDGNSKFIN